MRLDSYDIDCNFSAAPAFSDPKLVDFVSWVETTFSEHMAIIDVLDAKCQSLKFRLDVLALQDDR